MTYKEVIHLLGGKEVSRVVTVSVMTRKDKGKRTSYECSNNSDRQGLTPVKAKLGSTRTFAYLCLKVRDLPTAHENMSSNTGAQGTWKGSFFLFGTKGSYPRMEKCVVLTSTCLTVSCGSSLSLTLKEGQALCLNHTVSLPYSFPKTPSQQGPCPG